MTLHVSDVIKALQASWGRETGYDDNSYSEENPFRGQCVVSSLIIQDYFGGDLVRVAVTGEGIDEKHYFNRLDDGTCIDTTRSQYTQPVTITDSPVDLVAKGCASNREYVLSGRDTRLRYEILRKKVQKKLLQRVNE